MKKSILLAMFSVSIGFASAAAAQEAPPAGAPEPAEGGAAGGGTTTYDFDDDLVTGDLVRPDGEMLRVRRRGDRASLIQIREHFIPEMLKSVEDL
jgi:hypothetical protein